MQVGFIGTGGRRKSSSTSSACQPKLIIDHFGFSLLFSKPQSPPFLEYVLLERKMHVFLRGKSFITVTTPEIMLWIV